MLHFVLLLVVFGLHTFQITNISCITKPKKGLVMIPKFVVTKSETNQGFVEATETDERGEEVARSPLDRSDSAKFS